MQNIKNHHVFVVLVVLVILAAAILSGNSRRNYSINDFGVTPLLRSDCSTVMNANINSPVSISFNVNDVSSVRNQIKSLIAKYGGNLTDDSFSSYPSFPDNTVTQDSSNITATFEKSRNEFLAELSSLIKSYGGVESSYTFSNGSQTSLYGSSAYTSCISMMQNIYADVLQLEVFTRAIKRERDPSNISLLSQSISNMKSALQSEVSNVNSLLASYEKPSVTISLSTLQK